MNACEQDVPVLVRYENVRNNMLAMFDDVTRNEIAYSMRHGLNVLSVHACIGSMIGWLPIGILPSADENVMLFVLMLSLAA